MARKKRNQKAARQGRPFNNPFAGLKKQLKAVVRDQQPAAPARPEPVPEADDQALFVRAMAGVRPLDPSQRARRPRSPGARRPRLDAQPDEDLEVLARLADLISGVGEFDLRYSDEFVQGSAPGVGPGLLGRLAAGEFPVQDYLDLHGLGEQEALEATQRFLAQSVAKGLRSVLLVHGRGLRSPGGVPVLKTALVRALSSKRFQKRVLAFCTAQPVDGGTGAMYVLLRKWSGPQGSWFSP